MGARGERLLPSLVDEIAHSDPDRALYSVMKTKNPEDGFQDISAKEFARAVNRAAWYIEQSLGPAMGFPTLTYMGPQDLVYGILVLACIKTGYKLFLSSPRNTLEAHLHLLNETDCHTFLMPPGFPLPVVKQILGQKAMRVLEIPDLQYWIKEEPVKHYPYTKTFTEARLDPFVVLHTSGSTGMPKPIIQTHGTTTTLDAFTALPELGYLSAYPAMCAGTRLYLAFPLFHCGGILMLLSGCIYSGYTAVLGSFPPSADVANGVIVHGNVQQCIVPSMTLVDLANVPEYLENLARLEQVSFGGGPLPRTTGGLVSTRTRLMNCLGTTECGIIPHQLCDPEDWAYMSVSPLLGHEYRPVSDDLYEQVIVRDPKLWPYQGIFSTFPELQEWPMKDLYSKHPTKENVWLYRGRIDDIIVFSTGEKLNPLSMEDVITSNPAANATLIAGLGRFQSSVLIEVVDPPTNDMGKRSLLDRIWPSVQAANEISPSHGRIHRNMILFTSADKPMLRASKGTVQRKLTLELYRQEFDLLYELNEQAVFEADNSAKSWHTSTDGEVNVKSCVQHILATSTDIDIQAITPDADLFELGLDSLQVTLIVRKTNAFLSAEGKSPTVNARMVYSNPNMAALIAMVAALAEGETLTHDTAGAEEKMQKLYEQYSTNLPPPVKHQHPKPTAGDTVLLTGSTGSLGAYILDSLFRDKRVSHIFCLNRGPDSQDRQLKSLAAKGIPPPSGEKVTYLDADLSQKHFGLSPQTYQTILDEATIVIHNAWQVDFNLSLSSFATHVGIVRGLVDFSAASRLAAKLFFISSIGAVTGWPKATGQTNDVPEETFDDWTIPEPTGYGQSKFVSERLLDTAAKESNISSVICRVGQVAGPTKAAGMWPKQEWLPSLIASSKQLGILPESLGQDVIDWVPVDVLGQVIVELALPDLNETPHETGALVYHAANPQRTTWGELLKTVKQDLDAHRDAIEVVPLEQWVEALRKSGSEGETADMAQIPAAKILDFFEGLVNRYTTPALLDVKGAVASSPTLAHLGPVDNALVENWMRQWSF
ncbi:putative Acetyl-CoA synthetase-like protein [Seiridium cardinale]